MQKNKRSIHFIERKFQTQFILRFCLLVILGSLITGGLLYFFSMKTSIVSFENTRAVVKSTAEFIFPILIQTIVIVTIIIALFAIMLTLLISHKIAGPLYRFKKELKMIKEGDLASDFKIRADDQLQDVAGVLSSMKGQLRESLRRVRDEVQKLEDAVSSLEVDLAKKSLLDDKIRKIKGALSNFKL